MNEPTEEAMDTALMHRVIALEPNVITGKYLVGQLPDESFYLAGLDVLCIGGHQEIFRLLQHAQHKDSREHLNKLHDSRPTILEALDVASKMPALKENDVLGGGLYQFANGTLRLFHKSDYFGAVSPAVLQKFQEPIKEYCSQRNLKLDEILIE